MSFSIDHLKSILAQAIKAEGALPDIQLLAGERMAKSGHLFADDFLFTRYVAGAISDKTGLFADVPLEAGELLLQQGQASVFLSLFYTYKGLMQQAWDAYLCTQSDATQKAMTVVQQVRGDDDRPYPHPRQEERKIALCQAEELLTKRKAQKRRAARRTQQPIASGPIAPITMGPITMGPMGPIAPIASARPARSTQQEAALIAERATVQRLAMESAGYGDDRTALCPSLQLRARRRLAAALRPAPGADDADRARREYAHPIQPAPLQSPMSVFSPDPPCQTEPMPLAFVGGTHL